MNRKKRGKSDKKKGRGRQKKREAWTSTAKKTGDAAAGGKGRSLRTRIRASTARERAQQGDPVILNGPNGVASVAVGDPATPTQQRWGEKLGGWKLGGWRLAFYGQ